MKRAHVENTVGPWARLKLDALQRYLEAYMVVMKNQPFKLVFVDAFAGAGISRVRGPAAAAEDYPTFLDHTDEADQQQFILGSPMRALGLERPFDHYRFVEMDPNRASFLEDLKAEFPGREIKVRVDEANSVVQDIAQKFTASHWRGVAFLDPYGAHLHWATVAALARTGKFDVIINFPLDMAINRLVKRDGNIPLAWQDQLDLCFGCPDWREASYFEDQDLFGATEMKREDAASRLLALYMKRLKDAFGNVSQPSLIRNTRGSPLYYLIWASSNPRGKKIADHILGMGEKTIIR